MKTFKLLPQFIMDKEDIKQYNLLPDNMPDIKLNKKQIELVNMLYRKYIGKTIDNQNWSLEMYKVEQKEKWPSGPRVKSHEAMRMILNNLVWKNERPKLTNIEAAELFHSALSCRPMYAKLIYKIYQIG